MELEVFCINCLLIDFKLTFTDLESKLSTKYHSNIIFGGIKNQFKARKIVKTVKKYVKSIKSIKSLKSVQSTQ